MVTSVRDIKAAARVLCAAVAALSMLNRLGCVSRSAQPDTL